jgi:hypothetical protein
MRRNLKANVLNRIAANRQRVEQEREREERERKAIRLLNQKRTGEKE